MKPHRRAVWPIPTFETIIQTVTVHGKLKAEGVGWVRGGTLKSLYKPTTGPRCY